MSAASSTVAAVTGGTSGIGRAIALKLAAEGAVVAFCGRNEEEGAAVAELIRADGGTGHFSRVDVADGAAVEAWIADIAERFGGPHWLVNNAGMNGRSARLEECSHAEFEQVIATNLLSAYYTAHAAIPMMRAQGRGSIVNLGSTASVQGYALLSGYTASKHAIVGLTKSIALENSDIPIRANCICPGPVDTPLMRGIEELVNPGDPAAAREMFAGTTALKRYGTPQEIADLVAFLLSDSSAYVTGTAISIDGGVTTGVG